MLVFENKFLRVVDAIYGNIVKIGSNLQSTFLLYMRLMWGHKLFLHGIQKITHKETVIQFFGTLDLTYPVATTYIVSFFEVACGLLFVFGFMSRLAALPVMIIMISALSLAHSDAFIEWRFLFEPMRLVQQAPYPFLVTAFLIFIFGPGRVSIDAWFKRWSQKQPKF
ncbi:MAG TPA: DoxX family protein [Chlamydiales bacterium]|nr:DoxX family protein [Chlamydiales bacterium]